MGWCGPAVSRVFKFDPQLPQIQNWSMMGTRQMCCRKQQETGHFKNWRFASWAVVNRVNTSLGEFCWVFWALTLNHTMHIHVLPSWDVSYDATNSQCQHLCPWKFERLRLYLVMAGCMSLFSSRSLRSCQKVPVYPLTMVAYFRGGVTARIEISLMHAVWCVIAG